MNGLVVDLFAGGGGASLGIEAALGRSVDVAINHDAVAIAVHRANHPGTRHLTTNVWDVDPLTATAGEPVELLWASPDCTHFSVAKGGKPRRQRIRSLAWVVVKWAKAARPRVIALENVSEFQGWGPLDREGHPIKARMGETFRRWKRSLERLGYEVDHRVLDASHYGAPTRRRRLFLVARCDGKPITWPEPTHGKGRLPLRTAAECIDWQLPCPSIFERKRPLADKTLWRIAQGIRRFVLESPAPFIIRTDHHQSHATNAFSAEDPLGTITSANGHALLVPYVAGVGGRSGQAPATSGAAPLGTVTAKNDRALVAPTLIKVNHGKRDARGEAIDEPLTTVTATQRGHALVAPVLAQMTHGEIAKDGSRRRGRGAHPVTEPHPTITASGVDCAVIAPTLIQTGYGEREGQAARVPGLGKPLGTIISGGASGGNGKHALLAAFLAKHYTERSGCVNGQKIDQPAATITASDHHALAAVALAKFRGSEAEGHTGAADVEEPLPTITAGGNHVAEVRAFLTAYYGTDGTVGKGQTLLEPMRTVTARHRLGLVTVSGVDYQIVDIGMRMLEPHELLAAQFGRFAATYDLSAARTKSGMVRLIGNSVAPEVAEAVVAANVPRREERAA